MFDRLAVPALLAAAGLPVVVVLGARQVGKRLTKSPKVYLRDSGLLHHLLNIGSAAELHDHPSRGASWKSS